MYLVVLHPEKCARAFAAKKKRKTVNYCSFMLFLVFYNRVCTFIYGVRRGGKSAK
jgi:hypothetical protein